MKQGLAAVSMDDVAGHLRLPAGTLPRWFLTEGLLVQTVVDVLASLLYKELLRQKERSTNTVEKAYALLNWAKQDARASYAALLRHIKAYFAPA